jgi:endonuclease YncB( thermonuclease family)
MFRLIIFILSLSLSLLWAQNKGDVLRGQSIKISDGDTFHLMSDDGVKYKIRIYGIDCPEKDQPFGEDATNRLGQLISEKNLQVKVRDIDAYGRVVGIVEIPDQDIQDVSWILISEGLAWWYKRYAPKDSLYEGAENMARYEGKGLWQEPGASIAPWTWRKNKKKFNKNR